MVAYDDIFEQYFVWLKNMVDTEERRSEDYICVLWKIYNQNFSPSLRMDLNRVADGYKLREMFVRFNCYDRNDISEYMNMPSNLLEVIIAIAMRCENDIMIDLEEGDHFERWFWRMIFNLGFGDMTNLNYDELEADRILNRFALRRYSPDGYGSLFYIEGCQSDMRKVDIWTQLNWYLNYITEGGNLDENEG